MKQFVPIEDEFPTDARRGARRLVPYQPGLACHHAWQPGGVEGGPDVAERPFANRFGRAAESKSPFGSL